MSPFEQFILSLIPAILQSILAALKITPGSLPPTVRTILESIDAGLDAILGDPPAPVATPHA